MRMSFGCGRASRELKKRNCLASQNFILLTPSSVAESIEFKCNLTQLSEKFVGVYAIFTRIVGGLYIYNIMPLGL